MESQLFEDLYSLKHLSYKMQTTPHQSEAFDNSPMKVVGQFSLRAVQVFMSLIFICFHLLDHEHFSFSLCEND